MSVGRSKMTEGQESHLPDFASEQLYRDILRGRTAPRRLGFEVALLAQRGGKERKTGPSGRSSSQQSGDSDKDG